MKNLLIYVSIFVSCLSETSFGADAAASEPTTFMMPRVIKNSDTYAETFSLVVDLDDGGYVQGQWAISNLGPGTEYGICRLALHTAGHLTFDQSRKMSEGDWHYIAAPYPVLDLAPCSLAASPDGLSAILEVDDYRVTVAIAATAATGMPPMAIPPALPGYPLRVGDGFYESEIIVPWANSTVTVSHLGQVQWLNGRAYLDHSRSTLLPKDLARSFVRFRGLQSKCPILLLTRFAPETSLGAGYRWTPDGGMTTLQGISDKFTLGDNKALPQITLSSAEQRFTIAARQVLLQSAPMASYGLLGSIIGRFAGNSVTTTYRAQLLQGSPCDGPVDGILEVTQITR